MLTADLENKGAKSKDENLKSKCYFSKVKVLFKFTKAGGNRSDDDTRRLLQVVKAQDEDKAVLKFWMTGLSVQYRNHMLSSAIQQSVGN